MFEQCAQFDQPAKEIGSSNVGSAEVPGLSLLAAEHSSIGDAPLIAPPRTTHW
jgi:hypothetical protein